MKKPALSGPLLGITKGDGAFANAHAGFDGWSSKRFAIDIGFSISNR